MRRNFFQLICQDHGQITKPSVELETIKENELRKAIQYLEASNGVVE